MKTELGEGGHRKTTQLVVIRGRAVGLRESEEKEKEKGWDEKTKGTSRGRTQQKKNWMQSPLTVNRDGKESLWSVRACTRTTVVKDNGSIQTVPIAHEQ